MLQHKSTRVIKQTYLLQSTIPSCNHRLLTRVQPRKKNRKQFQDKDFIERQRYFSCKCSRLSNTVLQLHEK